MSNGILTQSAESVLQDLDEFYFGYLPWLHDVEFTSDRSQLLVTMSDPDDDEDTKTYTLSAEAVKKAFSAARSKGYRLCCADQILSEQLGVGCAQDADIILQTACYRELVFA